MSTRWEKIEAELTAQPRSWLVTGAAGFIASNLVERLLKLNQRVVGLDSFVAGHQVNLDEVRAAVANEQWARFKFVQGDICDAALCQRLCVGVDAVLHQAALGSVPRSIADPVRYQDSNVTGFLNMLDGARLAGVKSFVYASSSAVYGDSPELPKTEDVIGAPLSPYSATKLMNEIYGTTYHRSFGFRSIGLRYFNVYGPRQDPEGAYAAVIPKWISSLIRGEQVFINGDGSVSRDFCFVGDVVQANVLAATTTNPDAWNQVYNVAVGRRTTLNELFNELKLQFQKCLPAVPVAAPHYREFRAGDIPHSLADISKAKRLLEFEPQFNLEAGLESAFGWYLGKLRQ
ncbi:MAG: hypothetical protein RLY20_2837 [Verrucomicrobiota bacterium]|jgi:UDP-N-acetylglucosamine 4-epimerase